MDLPHLRRANSGRASGGGALAMGVAGVDSAARRADPAGTAGLVGAASHAGCRARRAAGLDATVGVGPVRRAGCVTRPGATGQAMYEVRLADGRVGVADPCPIDHWMM